MEQRSQFTFYDSFYRAVSRIRKAADRALAYDAICAYALTGELPDTDKLPDSVAIAFEMIKPNLDASRRKAESGKRGGESKQSANGAEASGKQTASKQEAKAKQEKEQEKEQDKEQMLLSPKPPRGAKFTPPTVDEVAAYCRERNNGIDAQHFVDYYAQQQWKLSNGNKMADWKAAVRTWESWDKKHTPQRKAPPAQYQRSAQSWAELAARMDEEGL